MGWDGYSRPPRYRRGRNRGRAFIWVFLGLLFLSMNGGRWLVGGAGTFVSLILFVIFAIVASVVVNSIVRGATQGTSNTQSRIREGIESLVQQFSGDEPYSEAEKAKRSVQSAQDVANQALVRAGNKPDSWLLNLEEIGILAYTGEKKPDGVWTGAVSAQASHLRPYVVINLPYKQGRGTIRFQLFDETGEKRFDKGKIYDLKQGPNFVYPPTWLPMEENHPGGRWTLRVNIGDRPLAIHEFTVREGYNGTMGQFLTEDGEIDSTVSSAVLELGDDSSGMSLDELLAFQEDDAQEADTRLR